MAKVGRPSTYDPKYVDMVIALGTEGKSQHQISAAIEKPLSTIRSWAEQHEEFSHALTRAKELEQAWWEDKGQAGIESRDFNAPLWKANVASRFRATYGDRVVHEGGDKPLRYEDVGKSPVEIARQLAHILDRGVRESSGQS